MSGFNKTLVIELDSINDDFEDYPDWGLECINDVFTYVEDTNKEISTDIFGPIY